MISFPEFDDIGYNGVQGQTLTKEDRYFYALKGEEARQRYYAELGKTMTPEEIAAHLLKQRGIYPTTTAAGARQVAHA